jgi:hypothetical protein
MHGSPADATTTLPHDETRLPSFQRLTFPDRSLCLYPHSFSHHVAMRSFCLDLPDAHGLNTIHLDYRAESLHGLQG